ncbi:MAG: tetratricopeptide repeat protein [Gammaproteobacteria bacterium]|jgi:predicted AlkP superfamily phosphohydrolase/phosphomutase/tetratricopeptide (TPR) repeat protein|nr:tetratricopeptide repeat protein [Gammaproteobacteria bacterium]
MTKTLLIGWDAADWKVISPLIDAGEMPNLAHLIEHGVMGNLATLYPVLSPMLWTSIATGKRAHKHGIHGFSEPDPASGGARPITNLGRKTKAVWNILNQQGLRSHVIGWWPSYPCEPINGVMVSDHFKDTERDYLAEDGETVNPWPLRPGHVHPEALREQLAEFRVHPQELDGETLQLFVPKAAEIDQAKDKRLYSVAKIVAECASVQAAATWVMQQQDWDFTAVYFDAIDHFCHGFMRYHPPRLGWVSEADFELYKDVVNSGYRFHDMMLGVLMDLAGPDTNVIICSDHGFHPDHLRVQEIPNEPAGPADEHRHFGVFAACGPGFKRDELVFGATLLDITPTILRLYDLPVGEDMDGRPLLQALREPTPIAPIPSWDDVPGDDGRHPEDVRIDPVDARESLQQLVDLGYIEDVGEDQKQVAETTVKELRYNLARDLADSGKLTEALAIHAELWETHPDESRFGLHRFNGQLRQGDTAAARETLALLERRKQDYAERAAAEVKQLQEDWKDKQPEDVTEQEQRRLRKLRKQAGTNQATFAWLRGRLLAAEGRHGEALVAFQQAEQVQMHNRPSLFQAQGEALLAMRRFADAEARFHKVLEIDPVNADGSLGLGRALLMQRGKAEEALAAVSNAIGLVYQNPRAHYLHGAALMRLGRTRDAKAAFETAVAQNPVFPAAHRRLARLAWRAGDDAATEHQLGLARAAVTRIRAVRDGAPRPSVHEAARLEPEAIAKPGDLGAPKALPPLAEDEIVAQLLPALTATHRYRVIFAERPLTEIIASQRVMLERSGKQDGRLAERQLAGTFAKQIAQVRRILSPHGERVQVLSVPYHEALSEPEALAARLNAFLGGGLDAAAIAAAVEPGLRRQRGGDPEETSALQHRAAG